MQAALRLSAPAAVGRHGHVGHAVELAAFAMPAAHAEHGQASLPAREGYSGLQVIASIQARTSFGRSTVAWRDRQAGPRAGAAQEDLPDGADPAGVVERGRARHDHAWRALGYRVGPAVAGGAEVLVARLAAAGELGPPARLAGRDGEAGLGNGQPDREGAGRELAAIGAMAGEGEGGRLADAAGAIERERKAGLRHGQAIGMGQAGPCASIARWSASARSQRSWSVDAVALLRAVRPRWHVRACFAPPG